MRTILLLMFVFIVFTSCNSIRMEVPKHSTHKDSFIQSSTRFADRDIVDTIMSLKDTTMSLGNSQLSFRKMDSIGIPDLYEDAKVREDIINQYDNSFEAAKAVEKYVSRSQGKYFQRTVSGLNLYLTNSQRFTLIDDVLEEEYYTYEHYLPELNAFVIRVQWNEGNTYMLVNRNSGSKKYVVGQVYPSQGGLQAIAIREDLQAGYGSNGFELLSRQADSLISNLTVETGDWAPIGAKWLTASTLILKTKKLLENDSVLYKTEYYKLTIK